MMTITVRDRPTADGFAGTALGAGLVGPVLGLLGVVLPGVVVLPDGAVVPAEPLLEPDGLAELLEPAPPSFDPPEVPPLPDGATLAVLPPLLMGLPLPGASVPVPPVPVPGPLVGVAVPLPGGVTEQLRFVERAVTNDVGPEFATLTGATKEPSELVAY